MSKIESQLLKKKRTAKLKHNKKLVRKQEKMTKDIVHCSKIFPAMSMINPLVTKQVKHMKKR